MSQASVFLVEDTPSGLAPGHDPATALAAFATPLLIAVALIGLIDLSARSLLTIPGLADFRAIALYGFTLSFVAAAPVCAVLLQRLDAVLRGPRAPEAAGLILAAIALAMAAVTPFAVTYHLILAEFDWLTRATAAASTLLATGLWVALGVLLRFRGFGAILLALCAGAALALPVAAGLAPRFGAGGLTAGFVLGLGVASGLALGQALAWFRGPLTHLREAARSLLRYPDIALTGFSLALALWIDNWLMWGAPEAQAAPGGLLVMASYDRAIVFAQIIMAPGIALFLWVLEPEFRARLAALRPALFAHGGGKRVERDQKATHEFAVRALGKLFVLETALAVLAVLLSPHLMTGLGMHHAEASIFRFAVWGAAAHTVLAVVLVWLTQLRRHTLVLGLATLYLALNASLTMITIDLGSRWYGYGYLLATTATLAVASLVLFRDLRRLPYLLLAAPDPDQTQ